MRIIAAFLVACFVCGAAKAETRNALPQTSLFFTGEEAHQAELLAQKNQIPGQGDLNLGAVFYYAPDDWVLWLRGEKYTPDMSHDDIKIEQVSANQVRFLWKAEDGSGEHDISLAPNDTYQISSGKIIHSR